MNELFRTFNPHEETTRAAREWNQGPSYEDYFTSQFDRGITNANVNDSSLFKEVQENAALGAAPYDQFKRTSRDPSTWSNSPYWRDAVTAAARDRGTAVEQAYLANYPWANLGYEQHAGQNVPPWMGVFPRMSRDEETVGFDLNLNDPFGFGGEALLDYNVSPDNIYDMTHPLRGNAKWDAILKYVKRF